MQQHAFLIDTKGGRHWAADRQGWGVGRNSSTRIYTVINRQVNNRQRVGRGGWENSVVKRILNTSNCRMAS